MIATPSATSRNGHLQFPGALGGLSKFYGKGNLALSGRCIFDTGSHETACLNDASNKYKEVARAFYQASSRARQ